MKMLFFLYPRVYLSGGLVVGDYWQIVSINVTIEKDRTTFNNREDPVVSSCITCS